MVLNAAISNASFFSTGVFSVHVSQPFSAIGCGFFAYKFNKINHKILNVENKNRCRRIGNAYLHSSHYGNSNFTK